MTLRRPEEFSHHEADLPGARIHYVREGSGPPLLLLHGWPGFWFEYHKVIEPLAQDFDVIVPDLRGYGDSEKPDLSNPGLYHLNLATDDQAHLLEHLGIDRAYIVGNDWSAMIAHKFVRKYRHLTDRAMIINPIMPGWEELWMTVEHLPESWYALFHQLDLSVALVSSSREACRLYFKHFLDHWSVQQPLLTDEEMEIYTDNFMKPGNIHGGINMYRANLDVQTPVWTPLDHTVSDVPMTFLSGLGERVNPQTWSYLVTRWYTNYTIDYLEDCGHFMMVEKPDYVVEKVRSAFRRDV